MKKTVDRDAPLPPAPPPSVKTDEVDRVLGQVLGQEDVQSSSEPTAARLPPGRRLLLVLPASSLTLIQVMAGQLNTTQSSIVHMAVMQFFSSNPYLRHHAEVDQFLKGGQPREGG